MAASSPAGWENRGSVNSFLQEEAKIVEGPIWVLPGGLGSQAVSVSSVVGPMKSCSALVGVERPLASNFSFPRAFRGASSPDASASKWHRLWSLPSGQLAVGRAALAALGSSREDRPPREERAP